MSRDYILEPFRAPISLQIDYARELNAQQHTAVTAPPGPALVIAGAGSGKTRTLIYRVAYLLEQGIPPERALLLTFTNKAAKDLIATCVAEADIEVTKTRFPKAEVLGDIFSMAVNTEKQIADILEEQYEDFLALVKPVGEIQQRYAERKRAANAMDFDDLLVLWLKLL